MRYIVCLCLGLLSFWGSGPAEACTCKKISLKQASQQARVVFAAKVLARTIDKKKSRMLYRLQVSRYWKGKIGKVAVLREVWGPCATYMEKGKRYLIFAKSSKGIKGLSTWLCSGTRLLRSAKRWRKRLGKGKRPRK